MRKKLTEQFPLMRTGVEHSRADEIASIGRILDEHPTIFDLVHADLTKDVRKENAGANGMSTEQVVRAAIIKQLEGFPYEDLAFHIIDSETYRSFCHIGFADKGFCASTLCSNIKKISPETWEVINDILIGIGKDDKVEKGREVRVDCTVVSSCIHEPMDSNQLWDGVRVLTRKLGTIKTRFVDYVDIVFTDHTKRAKRRMLGVLNAKKDKVRNQAYTDLLKVTRKTVSYAQNAVSVLVEHTTRHLSFTDSVSGVIQDLNHYIDLTLKVIDQTERRVIRGEKVPASEKIVSIFEPHTDVIVKDRRETLFGHKICLTGGKSNLILDCAILEGNPADSTLVEKMFDRQKDIYGRYPLKAALDGGFASKENLKIAKAMQIKDVCFAKGRGLKEEDMCRSSYVYKRLRRFRAGIESGISWLKRCFGLGLCNWKGLRSFKSYVWASIVSANLLTLARHRLSSVTA